MLKIYRPRPPAAPPPDPASAARTFAPSAAVRLLAAKQLAASDRTHLRAHGQWRRDAGGSGGGGSAGGSAQVGEQAGRVRSDAGFERNLGEWAVAAAPARAGRGGGVSGTLAAARGELGRPAALPRRRGPRAGCSLAVSSKGAQRLAEDAKQMPALIGALHGRNWARAERILRNSKDEMIEAADQTGNTALHWAVFLRPAVPAEILTQLLGRLGYEALAKRNTYGLTALHFAVGCSQQAPAASPATLAALLAGSPAAAAVKNQFAQLPLHVAAATAASSPSVAGAFGALLAAHPPAAAEHDSWGAFPLHVAVLNRLPLPQFEALVAAHPPAVGALDEDGRTPVHLLVAALRNASASSGAMRDLAKLELCVRAHPAVLSVAGDSGRTPLAAAVYYQCPRPAVELLLDAAAAWAPSRGRELPLHIVLRYVQRTSHRVDFQEWADMLGGGGVEPAGLLQQGSPSPVDRAARSPRSSLVSPASPRSRRPSPLARHSLELRRTERQPSAGPSNDPPPRRVANFDISRAPVVPASRGGPAPGLVGRAGAAGSRAVTPAEPVRGLGSRGQVSQRGRRLGAGSRAAAAATAAVRRGFEENQADWLAWAVETLLAVPPPPGSKQRAAAAGSGGGGMCAVVDGKGNTPLHLAAGRQLPQPTLLRLLREHPAAAGQPNNAGQLPLHLYLLARFDRPGLEVVANLLEAFPAGAHHPAGPPALSPPAHPHDWPQWQKDDRGGAQLQPFKGMEPTLPVPTGMSVAARVEVRPAHRATAFACVCFIHRLSALKSGAAVPQQHEIAVAPRPPELARAARAAPAVIQLLMAAGGNGAEKTAAGEAAAARLIFANGLAALHGRYSVAVISERFPQLQTKLTVGVERSERLLGVMMKVCRCLPWIVHCLLTAFH